MNQYIEEYNGWSDMSLKIQLEVYEAAELKAQSLQRQEKISAIKTVNKARNRDIRIDDILA
jgi:hypothetical protein